jgi:hypothetical protein
MLSTSLLSLPMNKKLANIVSIHGKVNYYHHHAEITPILDLDDMMEGNMLEEPQKTRIYAEQDEDQQLLNQHQGLTSQ